VYSQRDLIRPMAQWEYDDVRNSQGFIVPDPIDNFQVVQLEEFSETLWFPTLPIEKQILEFLLSDATASLQLDFLFTRDQPPEQLSISGTSTVSLQREEQLSLAALLVSNSTNFTTTISNISPRFLHLPLTGSVSFYSGASFNASIVLYQKFGNTINSSSSSESDFSIRWWSLRQTPQSNTPWLSNTGIQLVTISAEAPHGLAATFAAGGLLGLYVGLVLSVGRFLRMWVNSLVSRIYLDDMPNVEKLMKMCEDIFIARQCGDLLLEEYLYRELIDLFRAPARLVEITKKTE